jgi:hypothetical protein
VASRLSNAVSFRGEPGWGVEAADITLVMKDGTKRHRFIEAAKGSLQAPLPDQQIEDKLRELCRWGASGCDAQPLIAALWSLDSAQDAGRVMPLAAG